MALLEILSNPKRWHSRILCALIRPVPDPARFVSLRFSSLTLALVLSVSLAAALPLQHKPLSRAERLKIFDQVWETVRDKYYDPQFNGVNWDLQRRKFGPLAGDAESNEEFYGYLKLMVGELRDSHTRVHSPEERESRESNHAVTAGLEVFDVEGQTAVVAVAPNSQAERAGIRPGMVITALDEMSIRTVLARMMARAVPASSERAEKVSVYRNLLSGHRGARLRLTVLDQRQISRDIMIELEDSTANAPLEWKRLDKETGFIKFRQWDSVIAEDFREALGKLSTATRLVIDLRGNSGGSGSAMYRIANLFFKDPVSFGEYIPRKGRSTIVKSFPRRNAEWDGSIAVLLDEASRSSSELFAAIMQDHKKAIVVGRQSCGCVLGVSSIKKLKGGGELTVSEVGVLSPSGRRLELSGVTPNIVVPLRLRDLAEGRDAVLEAALGWLSSQPDRGMH